MNARLPTVLIVDGGAGIGRDSTALRASGIRVLNADTLLVALDLVRDTILDLVVLDWDALQTDRGHVLASLTGRVRAPILVVSGESSSESRLAAFESGAAGYLAKPVEPLELVQRVRGMINQREASSGGVRIEVAGGLELVYRERRVLFDGQDVDLTPREFGVLALLLAHRGEVLSVEDLSRGVWGHEALGDRNYVEKLVSRLRGKLARAGGGRVISTRRGFGYFVPLILPDPDPPPAGDDADEP